ncbi:Carbon-nitrogen hydrolase [Alkalibacterium subtropicum]|uniref:Carbon-nitrogen hydrolase n=1 Tax=Alkalibacterium subtropicum TaxID=753702 RepID=A0A1I1K969_9LACT|nr:carbon-nitrogen family hydrolase [Alkalibacterium subtropicum]SFC55238.1 Carbon-nitrogen hydrolase [Alkalibacterium subtropicum]
MKVCALQMDLAYKDTNKNKRKITELIDTAVMRNKPDVLVLPEMWNVSFFPDDLKENSDKDGEETKRFLSGLARKHQVNIVGGSVAVESGGHYYNTSYSFNREGELVHTYNKVHLFSPSNEHKKFTAGNELGIFELDGIKVGVATCYDLRFTEWIRRMALEDVQVLFIPAAWPHPRVQAWETLLCARAIENQFFVVGVNSIGTTDKLTFCGHSTIYSPLGERVTSAREEEKLLWADLDLDSIAKARREIAVYQDRRPELY